MVSDVTDRKPCLAHLISFNQSSVGTYPPWIRLAGRRFFPDLSGALVASDAKSNALRFLVEARFLTPKVFSNPESHIFVNDTRFFDLISSAHFYNQALTPMFIDIFSTSFSVRSVECKYRVAAKVLESPSHSLSSGRFAPTFAR